MGSLSLQIMALKLYTYPNNPRAARSLIAAEYNNVKIEVVPVQMGVTNKTKKFLALNPNGKVPTLETPEGGIFESNAIARYVARQADNGLYGRSPVEAGQVDQWLDWTRGDVEIAGSVWLYPIYGFLPNVPEATENAKADVKKQLMILNNFLLTRSYLVGERITLADIVVATSLVPFYTKVFDPTYRKPFPNVTRWFLTCVNQPNFKKVLGEITLCEQMEEASAAPAAAPAPVAPEKPAAAPAAAAPAKEEKEVIPPSKLNLEEWKRVYSNADDTRDACKWLWEHIDKEVNSTWFCTYKYNDELGATFMSSNLIGGFFQRLESFRKRGFGTLIVFGDNEKSAISGCFLVQGLEIPESLGGCPDAGSYEFVRCDYNDEAQRKKFDDLLCWETEFDGLKVSSGKVFK